MAQNLSNELQEKRVETRKELVSNIMDGKYLLDDREREEVISYLQGPEQPGKKQWSCPMCPDMVFDKKHDQVTHIREAHGQLKKFRCEYCDKTFPVRLIDI